jgi:hypothetical protein
MSFYYKRIEGGSVVFKIVPSILIFFVMGGTTAFVVAVDVVPNRFFAAVGTSIDVDVVVAVPSHVASSNTFTTTNDDE